MDNSNYRSSDYAKLKEADDKRRFINNPGQNSALDTTSNKYNITQLAFPENVNSNDYPHYVSFFINIRGKSKYNQENRFKDQAIVRPEGAGLTPDEISRGLNIAAVGAGAAIGVGAAKKFAGNAAKSGANLRSLGIGAAGAVAGAATAAGASIIAQKFGPDILKADKSYRISDVITLAVQEPPSVKYDVRYNETSLGTVFGALGKTLGIFEQNRAGSMLAEGGVLAGGALAGAALGAMTGGGLVGGALGAALGSNLVTGAPMQAMTKTKTNPFREMLFEQVSFRDFSFSYKFLPKSEKESKAIKDIIDTFKFHMHPELSAANLFFIYPAEFQIVYYFKNRENSYFHKIAPSALTSLTVEYGGSGGMSSFHDGTPTEVVLKMNFQELEVMTKERIELGY
jgi:hypothetical protein